MQASRSMARYFSHLRGLSKMGGSVLHEKEVTAWAWPYLQEHHDRVDAFEEAHPDQVITIQSSALRFKTS